MPLSHTQTPPHTDRKAHTPKSLHHHFLSATLSHLTVEWKDELPTSHGAEGENTHIRAEIIAHTVEHLHHQKSLSHTTDFQHMDIPFSLSIR